MSDEEEGAYRHRAHTDPIPCDTPDDRAQVLLRKGAGEQVQGTPPPAQRASFTVGRTKSSPLAPPADKRRSVMSINMQDVLDRLHVREKDFVRGISVQGVRSPTLPPPSPPSSPAHTAAIAIPRRVSACEEEPLLSGSLQNALRAGGSGPSQPYRKRDIHYDEEEEHESFSDAPEEPGGNVNGSFAAAQVAGGAVFRSPIRSPPMGAFPAPYKEDRLYLVRREGGVQFLTQQDEAAGTEGSRGRSRIGSVTMEDSLRADRDGSPLPPRQLSGTTPTSAPADESLRKKAVHFASEIKSVTVYEVDDAVYMGVEYERPKWVMFLGAILVILFLCTWCLLVLNCRVDALTFIETDKDHLLRKATMVAKYMSLVFGGCGALTVVVLLVTWKPSANDRQGLKKHSVKFVFVVLAMVISRIGFMGSLMFATNLYHIHHACVTTYAAAPCVFFVLSRALKHSRHFTKIDLFGAVLVLIGILLLYFDNHTPDIPKEKAEKGYHYPNEDWMFPALLFVVLAAMGETTYAVNLKHIRPHISYRFVVGAGNFLTAAVAIAFAVTLIYYTKKENVDGGLFTLTPVEMGRTIAASALYTFAVWTFPLVIRYHDVVTVLAASGALAAPLVCILFWIFAIPLISEPLMAVTAALITIGSICIVYAGLTQRQRVEIRLSQKRHAHAIANAAPAQPVARTKTRGDRPRKKSRTPPPRPEADTGEAST